MKRKLRALIKKFSGTETDSQKLLANWQKELSESLVVREETLKQAQDIIAQAKEKGLTLSEISAITGLTRATVRRIIKESKEPICLTNSDSQ